ncbi:tryptophan dimethylallyltransferase-domain-containing protein [Jackrogersella minutella]|nr:tryptophan dimethylallyltransferase-domain-containing protein [Jackrogersella minutella]
MMLPMGKHTGLTLYSRMISLLLFFKLGLELLISNLTLFLFKPRTAWEQVSSELKYRFNPHETRWWHRAGYALAVLLHNANYTHAAQVRILEFFAQRIVGNLGVTNETGAKLWKSFMTDDNNPIELSWDWHTGTKRPTVRFSVEPIGLNAGTPDDPYNERATVGFKQSILRALPNTDMRWFDHFDAYFNEGVECNSVEGHLTRVFWAFDLGEGDIASKAYFFPGYRAQATNMTNLQVISEAIALAPSCTPERLGAFDMFVQFVQEHERMGRQPLELDMLAIDMMACDKSRLKIYFRSRETDFGSVRETMSLGGRVTGPDMDVGLNQLRRLWKSLFGQEGASEDTPIGGANHRTAGILYNIEFHLGGQAPKAKIYIPVRHYARTDAHVIKSVSNFMDSQTGLVGQSSGTARDSITAYGRDQPPAERFGPRSPSSTSYAKAFSTIFTDDAIAASRGLHTYIGCSVQTGGALRVVSYINVQEEKLRDARLQELL